MKTHVRTMTAVVYARVSSKDQEREGFSIPAQLTLLHEHARQHGFEVLEEFIDVETAKHVLRRVPRTNAEMIDQVEHSSRIYLREYRHLRIRGSPLYQCAARIIAAPAEHRRADATGADDGMRFTSKGFEYVFELV